MIRLQSRSVFFRSFIAAGVLTLLVFGALVLRFESVFAATDPTNIVTYQGRLLNANYVPLSTGTADLKFSFWNDATATNLANCLWENDNATCDGTVTAVEVSHTDGLFSVRLGDSSITNMVAIPDAVFGDNASVWLEITVEGETLSPRLQMSAAPYAINANLLDGLDADDFVKVAGGCTDCLDFDSFAETMTVDGAETVYDLDGTPFDPNPGTPGDEIALLATHIDINDFRTLVFNVGEIGTTSPLEPSTLGINLRNSVGTFAIYNNRDFSDIAELANVPIFEVSQAGATLNSQSASGAVFRIDSTPTGGTNTTSGDLINLSADSLTSGNAIEIEQNSSAAISTTGSGLLYVRRNLTNPASDIDSPLVTFSTAGSAGTFSNDLLLLSQSNSSHTGEVLRIDNDGPGGAIYVDSSSSGELLQLFSSGTMTGSMVTFSGSSTNDFFFTLVNDGGTDSSQGISIQSCADSNPGTGCDYLEFLDGDGTLLGAIEGDGAGGVRFTGDAATLDGLDSTDFITITGGCTDCLDFDSLADVMTTDATTKIDVSTLHAVVFDLLGSGSAFQIYNANESDDPGTYSPMFVADNSSGSGQIRFHAPATSSQDPFVLFDLNDQDGIGVQYDCDGQNLDQCINISQFQPDLSGTYTTQLLNLARTIDDADVDLGGSTVSFTSNSTGANSDVSNLLFLQQNGSSGAVLRIDQDGTGRGIDINSFEGTEEAIYVRANTGITANEPLIRFVANETDFDQPVLALSQSGTASALSVVGLNILTPSAPLVTFTTDEPTVPVFSISESALADFSDNIVEFTGGAASHHVLALQNTNTTATGFGLSIQACETLNPSSACNFITFRDGDGDIIGAIEGNGSGGVTNASTGSDFAELFPGTLANFSEGDVLALNALGRVELATDSSRILGAYSSAPTALGNWFDGWQQAGTHVPVGLLGQLPVNVSAEAGNIQPGDYLTLGNEPGKVVKASASGYVLGRALEAHIGGSGSIYAFIEPKWVGIELDDALVIGQELLLEANMVATASSNEPSRYLSFSSSEWDGSAPADRTLSFYTDINATQGLTLNLQNDAGSDIFRISDSGDVFVSGRLYLSDRGSFQEDKYLYYDGSSGPGGDFIRTNASGFGVGSYDFAEMFPAEDSVQPGDVVVFGSKKEHIRKSGSADYTQLAGIVSTQPGFLAGENLPGHVPIALAGRVPTRVTDENGAIEIGDPLTLSAKPGYAAKATRPGQIVGYALESHATGEGLISVFVRVSYWGGDSSDNVVSNTPASPILAPNNALSVSGSSLTNIASISGIGRRWEIGEEGDILTQGEITRAIEAYDGSRINTTPAFSTQSSLVLRGTAKLSQGRAAVKFHEVDASFAKIIDTIGEYQVFLTPTSATGQLYTSRQDNDGFVIRESEDASNASVHWMVIAYEKDNVPEPVNPVDTEEDEPVDVDSEISLEDDSAASNESSIDEAENANNLTEEEPSFDSGESQVEDTQVADTDIENALEDIASPEVEDEGGADLASEQPAGAQDSTDAVDIDVDSTESDQSVE